MHLRHLGFSNTVLTRKTVLVSLIVVFMFVSSFLSGVVHEISVLSPAVGYFAGIGIANIKSTDMNKSWQLHLYVSILIGITLFNFVLNIFSMS
jgi:hypothetical protein